MKVKVDRVKNLSETLTALLDREHRSNQELLSSLMELIRALQGDSADRRFQHLASELKRLQERLDLLTKMAERDFLAEIRSEAEQLNHSLADSRAAAVTSPLIELPSPSLNLFCDSLVDRLIEVTGAERGFMLFYIPESTEAEVIAARNYQTRNLSLEEYDFSRTLLRDVFERGEPFLIEDASQDADYSNEASVIRLGLMSVVAAPLKQSARTIGALYLENNSVARAFDEDDMKLLEAVGSFAVFYLQHARLLPVAIERDSRVFLDASKASTEIIGQDPKILEMLGVISRIADSPATVLIEGESGTGKDLVARALHYQSARRDRPFVAINCAAIPDNLLESELFGHEKGAFTGATERYIGRIERASGGTLFLDEVSELAYPLQAKLLRFLQSNEFDRLGGKETIRVDVRVVAATSKDLETLIRDGKFQQALYYRLNVIPIKVPSLRERKGDIPLLVDHFLSKYSAVYGKEARVGREVYGWLREYSFPGNVRELENLIHRLLALATGEWIRIGDLPGAILQTRSERVGLAKDPFFELMQTPPADFDDLRRRRQEVRRMLAEQERQLIERVIEESGGNLTEAASRLGINRITLHKMLKKAGKHLNST